MQNTNKSALQLKKSAHLKQNQEKKKTPTNQLKISFEKIYSTVNVKLQDFGFSTKNNNLQVFGLRTLSHFRTLPQQPSRRIR